ncbi:MAG: cellulase family glycosylhydrolase [Oligoflexales bacterium]
MVRFLAFLGLALVCSCAPRRDIAGSELQSENSSVGKLVTEGRYFKDAAGRVVVLRSMNVAGDSKVPPFKTVKPADLAFLANIGVNSIRMLFIWEAFEPKKGVYDLTYLDHIESLVKEAANLGLYVVIDIHQDGYSRFSAQGCGAGFPEWTIPKEFPRGKADNGSKCKAWALFAISDVYMHRAWNAFYANKDGVRDSYLAMLEQLAKRVGPYGNLIGYDPLNEPWGFEGTELIDLYEDAEKRIRSVDPKAIIFVGPHAATNSGVVPTFLRKPKFKNFAYAPHYYNPILMSTQVWANIPPVSVGLFQLIQTAHLRFNVPFYLGEFGVTVETMNHEAYINSVYDNFDKDFLSGAQWNYTPRWTYEYKDGWNLENYSVSDDRGNLRSNFPIRPYPVFIAGQPKSFRWNGKVAKLEWVNNPALGATEVFAPSSLTGSWQTNPSASCSYSETTQRLRCKSSHNGLVTLSVEKQ